MNSSGLFAAETLSRPFRKDEASGCERDVNYLVSWLELGLVCFHLKCLRLQKNLDLAITVPAEMVRIFNKCQTGVCEQSPLALGSAKSGCYFNIEDRPIQWKDVVGRQ